MIKIILELTSKLRGAQWFRWRGGANVPPPKAFVLGLIFFCFKSYYKLNSFIPCLNNLVWYLLRRVWYIKFQRGVGAQRLEEERFCGTVKLVWKRVGGKEIWRSHRLFPRWKSSWNLIFTNNFSGPKIIKRSQYVNGQRGGRQPKLVWTPNTTY